MNRERGLQLYITCIGLLTSIVLAYATLQVAGMPTKYLARWLPVTVLFVGLGWFSSRKKVYISESSSHAMGTITQIAMLIALPFPVAIIAIGLAKILSEISLMLQNLARRSWSRPVINTGATVLANTIAGCVFYLLQGNHHIWSHDPHVLLALPALVAMVVTYHSIDVLVVVGAITWTSRETAWSVFVRVFSHTVLPELSLAFVGIIFAVLWHYSPLLSLFIVVPTVLSVRSFGAVARLRQETVEAVLKMAESIDYRDTGTYEHSQRLARLTKRLAQTLGLTPEHISEIVLASRVHDLGKIGISNDILLKQGPLTPEEREIMEEHPVIGANILASYSAFQGSVSIVRHHHERWDGKGYPDRLRGESIPMGSRIITVVDAFDAMTADRPYRPGMSTHEAVERLKDGMGTQFDPRICAVFIQLLIEDGTYVPPEPLPTTLHVVASQAV